MTSSDPSLTDSPSTGEPSLDAIAERAFTLWERLGRPRGRALELWTQAEKELQLELQQSGSNAAGRPVAHGKSGFTMAVIHVGEPRGHTESA